MSPAPASRSTVVCAGVPIDALTRRRAASDLLSLAIASHVHGVDVHLCNAYTLALADSDRDFFDMLCRSARNYPDGMSVVWANRMKNGKHLPNERVYGPDLFLDVLNAGQDIGIRHYLLGGAPDTLDALRAEIARRFPNAEIVGAESPPFRDLTEAEQAEQMQRIAKTNPQVVWVGLGTPKQDWEAARLASELPMVFVAVGAAFDFVAGHKRQAPVWMQDHGLEWSYRLATEPRRLWRRYLVGNTRFVYAALRR